MSDLSGINLNLLKILDVLLSKSHVTAASQALGLSQSGVSTALKQLRDLLEDPLLVREQGSQMYLTDYAKSIQGEVSRLTRELAQLFHREIFNPTLSTRVFHIGMSDYLSFVLLPNLITKLNHVAPNIKLIIHHVNYFNDSKKLENGEWDLVLGNFPDAPRHIECESLYEDYPVFVAYKDHPLFNQEKNLKLKDIITYPLIMVSFMNDPTDNYLDRLIKSKGLDATVSVVVPHALIALLSLKNNSYITHTVKRIAEPIAKQAELKFLPNPTDLPKAENKVPYIAHQYWYKTVNDDLGHLWLRGLIKETATKI